jgi:glycosyltransferase involved in cell wall biosynthesis
MLSDSSAKISVIMPVYNREKYLDDSIQSILKQSYKNFEFIIINDCSTDNSKNKIKFYAKKDKRIIFLENKKNICAAKSFEKGFNIAKGAFIARMDSDDISHKDRFKKQIQLFLSWPQLSVLGTGANIINSRGQIISKKLMPFKFHSISQTLKYSVPVFNPSVMIRTSAFKIGGFLDPSMEPADDLELWLRFFSKKLIITNLQEYLIYYRIHDNNLSTQRFSEQITKTFLVFNKYNNYFQNKKKNKVEKLISDFIKERKITSLIKIFNYPVKYNKSFISKLVLSFIFRIIKNNGSLVNSLNLIIRYLYWRAFFFK